MLEAAGPSFTFRNSPESIRNRVTHVVDSVAEALAALEQEYPCDTGYDERGEDE